MWIVAKEFFVFGGTSPQLCTAFGGKVQDLEALLCPGQNDRVLVFHKFDNVGMQILHRVDRIPSHRQVIVDVLDAPAVGFEPKPRAFLALAQPERPGQAETDDLLS